MPLIPFSSDHLRLHQALPFDIVDPQGVLLMPRGATISNDDQLQHLLAHALMVDEQQTEEWRRQFAGQLDRMLRQNVSLKDIASARATAAPAPAPKPATPLSLNDEISNLQLALAALLRDVSAGTRWPAKLEFCRRQVEALVERDADGVLYLLVQICTQSTEHYSSHHVFLCAVIAELAARHLGWPAPERESLMRAALAMNASIYALQNQLAQQDAGLTAEQQRRVGDHAAASAALLRQVGLDDALAIDVVQHHHPRQPLHGDLEGRPAAERLVQLLHRVDVFAAKISQRGRRAGMPAPLAARAACLGHDGQPDAVGGALIKALGIYPPGSFVELASGELAVVVLRGRRANQPKVVSLVGRDGMPLGVPAPRDTYDRRHEIKGAARPDQVRVRPRHAQILKLR